MDNNEEYKVSIEKTQQAAQPEKTEGSVIPPQYRYTASDSAKQFVTDMGNRMGDFANNKEKLEKVGLICACAGFIISFLFTIITCSRSAFISINSVRIKDVELLEDLAMLNRFRISYFFIFVIIGTVIAVVGGIMAFLSKRGSDFGMMAKITFIVVAVTLIFAAIPNITMCAYNNSLNNATDKMIEKTLDGK